jgi:hypothetical protein
MTIVLTDAEALATRAEYDRLAAEHAELRAALKWLTEESVLDLDLKDADGEYGTLETVSHKVVARARALLARLDGAQ